MLYSDSQLIEEIQKCARCGYCREKDNHDLCPVRSIIGFESSYARGKLHLAQLCLNDGSEQVTRNIIKKFYLCALCGNCFKHCPLNINTPKIITELRSKFLEKYNPLHDPGVIKNIVSNICHNPAIINNFISNKGKIEPTLYLLNKDQEDFLFFSGCMDEHNKDSLESIFKIFNYLGIKVSRLNQRVRCCGLPLSEFGDKNFLLTRISDNMNLFLKFGVKKIIVNCPGCLYAFKEYYCTDTDSELKFIHLTEFLNDNMDILNSENGLQATYHDPCLLGRYLGIYEAPRQLLSKMGISLKEMPRTKEESYCCGGGSLSLMYPEISREISKSRVSEAKKTGSPILLTSCSQCKRTLAEGNDQGIEILELTELLATILDKVPVFDVNYPLRIGPEISRHLIGQEMEE